MNEQHKANVLLVYSCPRPIPEQVGFLCSIDVRQGDLAAIWLKLLSLLAWLWEDFFGVQRPLKQLSILLAVRKLLGLLWTGHLHRSVEGRCVT